jgi:hypothetical protein
MKIAKRIVSYGILPGALVAFAWATGCSESGEDCATTQTCIERGGSAGEAGGGSDSGGAGAASGGASGSGGSSGSSSSGGSSGSSGSAGKSAGGEGGDSGAGGSSGEAGAGGGSSGPCDPMAADGEQGCASGEKCAWTRTSTTRGELACVPVGSVGIDENCTFDNTTPNGATYDDCDVGLACDGFRCKTVCGYEGTSDTCESGFACVRIENLFADVDERASLGVCLETCDPLTQTRIVNGTPSTCGINRGCYVVMQRPDETIAACANAGTPGHNQLLTPPVYSNSCAPGHYGRRVQVGGQDFECAAFCKPADVYMGVNDGGGTRPNYEGGDPRSPNWLSQPATCESVAGPSARPDVAGTGESCRYYGFMESHNHVTRFSNTLGVCVPHMRWRYDPTGGTNLTTPWPRCPTLTTDDVVLPRNYQSDALDWGCVGKTEPASLAFREKIRTPARIYLDRMHPNP